MHPVRIEKAMRAVKAMSRSFPRLVKKRPATRSAYSPRGVGDDRPNMRDCRFVFPVGDEPVTLPMQPRARAYLIAGLVIAILVAMAAAASRL